MTDARALVRGLGAAAAVLGTLAFVVGAPVRTRRAVSDTVESPTTREISALQLAQWIRDGKPGLRVLDLRDSASFETRHVPSAEWLEPMRLSAVPPTSRETMVLYSDDDLRDAQGVAWLAAVGHTRVYVVRGGLSAWTNEVIDPVVRGDSAAMVAALSRYFGGVPRASATRVDAGTERATIGTAKPKPRNATDEFGVAARRGC